MISYDSKKKAGAVDLVCSALTANDSTNSIQK